MFDAIKRLIELFAARSSDRATLDELIEMIDVPSTWKRGHNLFDRIRKKTLAAKREGDNKLDSQYLFEEACAKLLFNLSGSPAPFDADSPYWIVPNALVAGRHLGIDGAEIVQAVVGQLK